MKRWILVILVISCIPWSCFFLASNVSFSKFAALQLTGTWPSESSEPEKSQSLQPRLVTRCRPWWNLNLTLRKQENIDTMIPNLPFGDFILVFSFWGVFWMKHLVVCKIHWTQKWQPSQGSWRPLPQPTGSCHSGSMKRWDTRGRRSVSP